MAVRLTNGTVGFVVDGTATNLQQTLCTPLANVLKAERRDSRPLRPLIGMLRVGFRRRVRTAFRRFYERSGMCRLCGGLRLGIFSGKKLVDLSLHVVRIAAALMRGQKCAPPLQ